MGLGGQEWFQPEESPQSSPQGSGAPAPWAHHTGAQCSEIHSCVTGSSVSGAGQDRVAETLAGRTATSPTQTPLSLGHLTVRGGALHVHPSHLTAVFAPAACAQAWTATSLLCDLRQVPQCLSQSPQGQGGLEPEARPQPRFRVFVKLEGLRASGSTLGKQADRASVPPAAPAGNEDRWEGGCTTRRSCPQVPDSLKLWPRSPSSQP